ncbi:DegV family protein [Clostridium intestinale]|uniref:EDD domain protein, DegV family n=1 Tax=Clostridium intestinale DSM 6191 TaxID=1121320 RepID=A0A1M6DT22_9CLOT|nr:DegV family protein [Clostridium intestinale]SHI76325.1 EDD domain protein, DegV family [Clostridium intestinale DSM 6191]
MEKIALITDTTSDLPQDIIEKYNIKILPFRIIYKDREYKDKYEITPKEVYDNFEKEIPTSSLPLAQDMEELYDELEKEGYTHAIAITLSSGLSGISNALRLVSENHDNIESFVYDSKTISWGEGILVKKCAELIEQGKDFNYIKNILPELRKKVKLFFVVGTLEYLRKGGRIGRISGTIGDLLNLKPIVAVDDEGRYFTHSKVRGRKQSLNKMVNIVKEIVNDKEHDIIVLNGCSDEDCKYMIDQFEKIDNVSSVNYGGDISPVSGVHSGPGLVGVVLVEKE